MGGSAEVIDARKVLVQFRRGSGASLVLGVPAVAPGSFVSVSGAPAGGSEGVAVVDAAGLPLATDGVLEKVSGLFSVEGLVMGSALVSDGLKIEASGKLGPELGG